MSLAGLLPLDVVPYGDPEIVLPKSFEQSQKLKINYSKWTSSVIPSELRKAARQLDHIVCRLAPNGWIAGGALRSRIANDGKSDYDCYFPSYDYLEYARDNILADSELKATISFEDDCLITLTSILGKIDLVKRFHDTPIDTLRDFDFTVCCFAIDSKHIVYWLDQGLKDIKDKKLRLYHPSCPFSTQLRLQKYAVKGYIMDLDEHLKLANLIKDKEYDKTFKRLSMMKHNYSPKIDEKENDPFI